jgi:type IX secretion system PorP/SprF family membrane protein
LRRKFTRIDWHPVTARRTALIAMVVIFLPGFRVFSQQTTLITHYMFTNLAFNPATAGAGEGINVTGLIREQWIGFKDGDGNKVAPETMFLTADMPLKFLHGGIGLSLMQDKIGFFRNITLKLGYAYRTDLGPGDFSAGIMVNLNNSKLDFSKFIAIHDDDPLLLDKSEKSDLVADVSLGLYYRVPEKYNIGLSVDNLLQTKQKKLYYQDKRTFYLNGGYNWVLPGHPQFELQPSAIIRTDLAAFSFDVTGLVVYNKKIWGGLAYRYQDAVSALLGFSIKGVRIGLSYDLSTSPIYSYNSGSVEVMLNYCFKIETEKFRKTYRNTRFL